MKVFLFIIFFSLSLSAGYEEHVNMLYYSLDNTSLKELMAFYHLYPDTKAGKDSLSQAKQLIQVHKPDTLFIDDLFNLAEIELEAIIPALAIKRENSSTQLSKKELGMIERITNHLHHRSLKGHSVWTKDDVISLGTDEIDLARALLVFHYEDNPHKIKEYEAFLDLMALEILASLQKNYTEKDLLFAINDFIFFKKRYRFPPHSLWVKDVDLYTFLPSIIDSRQGVCLGVSTLYLCLSQRLNLPLKIKTPPGHIYLCYEKNGQEINIETTARGIHIPTKEYLSINTTHIKARNIREVIGLNYMNSAARCFHSKKYEEALDLYKISEIFLPDDPLIQTFAGYVSLFANKIEEGEAFLKKASSIIDPNALFQDTIIADYFNKKVDPRGIETIFMEVDETRESILEKKAALEKTLLEYPEFREGIFHLALTWLQLGREKEALIQLHRYHEIEKNNAVVSYYLANLSFQRYQYKECWEHLNHLLALTENTNHQDTALKDLERKFSRTNPIALLDESLTN